MFVRMYKIGEVHYRLLGTNGFHSKAKNEQFTAVGFCCRQNLTNENFTSSFGRLRQKIAPKSVPQVQHDYISSSNQSNHWFVTYSLPLLSSFLKLPSPLNSWHIDYNDGKQVLWPPARSHLFQFPFFYFLLQSSHDACVGSQRWKRDLGNIGHSGMMWNRCNRL